MENISPGSYDDIRRKDLKLLLLGDIVLKSIPGSATNDSRRGYVLNPFYAKLFRKTNGPLWKKEIKQKLTNVETLETRLAVKRDIKKIPVKIPGQGRVKLSPGAHNELQKAIIEEFLPRYGFGAELLYLGDTADKYLFLNKEKLESINFFEMSHDQLPDILAYSETKNWLYLIEAVHSSGAIDQAKLLLFEKMTEGCTAEIVYITAFSTREKFRAFVKDLAWETEVWIAESPTHLIHFNGEKFLGPY